MRKDPVLRAAALLLGTAALLSVLVLISCGAADPAPVRAEASPPPVDPLPSAAELSAAFERVAEAARPSVVNISSLRRVRAGGRSQRLPSPFFNTPFRDFFGDDFFEPFFSPREPRGGYVQQGLGTGVIVGEEGYIVTNNHVVENADEVTVKLSDERSFVAEVMGRDPKTDLAVLKIDAKNLQPAVLGDSEKLQVGEWVLAAGNPFGLSSTITAGIVSAKGRANVGLADYEDFIQTDAAINPGNSGGPLLNLRGEVVGINTAIFTKSGGYMGIGFAIPVNMVKSILNSLIEEGRVVRGWLGVTIQNLNEGLARSFGYDERDGVLVSDITPDGPADRAGFRRGDIIIRYDGDPVKNVDRLRSRVAGTEPGTEVAVEVFREGARKDLTVDIGLLEEETVVADRGTAPQDLGMRLRTLTPEIARQLDLEPETRGVVVTEIDPLGPAAKAGLRERDVITRIQDRTVGDVGEFQEMLRRFDLEEGVRLEVRSGPVNRFVFLQLTG